MEYYGPGMNGNYGGWEIFMMLFWLVILIVVVLSVVRILKNHESNTSNGSGSIDIVKERYAKGEITKEQFEQLKKDLSK